MSIQFNNLPVPSFVIVNNIHVSLLPPIKQKTVVIDGRAGSYDFGNEIGDREIKVDITIKANTHAELRANLRKLEAWLYYDEPKQLRLLDESDKYYLAKITNQTDLNQFVSIGQGTITFVCYDPYAYSMSQKQVSFVPIDTDPITIVNNGNTDAFPQIELTFNQDTTEWGILTDDQYMYFGQEAPVDSTTPAPQRTQVLLDDCSSTATWSSGILVDGGSITGGFVSDGNFILPNTYGTGTTWHGPALVKSLGQELQDFSLEYYINFKETKPNQLGRIEIYLLDINNVVIGKLAVVDATAKSKSGRVEARLGTASGGKYIVNSEIGKEFYTNFYGRLYLQRIGQKYVFQIGKLDSKYQFFGRFNQVYYDTSNSYQSKLAAIQIHAAQYGTNPFVPTVNVNEVRIWNENTLTSTQVPYVFRAGDTLFIDSATATILLNGEPAFNTLGNLMMDFIRLKPGATNLAVTDAIISSGSVTYRERWR